MNPNPPMKNGQRRCGTGNRLVWCDSQDLSQAFPHAGIMTMREGSREVRSHTPQPIIRPRGRAHQQKQPNGLWICHSWDAFKQSRLFLRFSFQEALHELGLSNKYPEDFHPLLARWQRRVPFHTTASGLTLRAALVKMSIPRGGTKSVRDSSIPLPEFGGPRAPGCGDR